MEAFAFYLLKSVIWISGFALVYLLFLQNERYFLPNRIFLIAGILSAFILPLVTWHYMVQINPEKIDDVSEFTKLGIESNTAVIDAVSLQSILMLLYLTVSVFMLVRTIWQAIPIIRLIKKSEVVRQGTLKLIQTAKYQSSFSFISHVFVNPSINKTELREIVNHEQEHIRQKHWIDLLLFEIIRVIQWFNPVVWLYGQKIRQNHEYLADRHALSRSLNPGIYHATLLNQVFGGSVISLTNSFNYSFNKKRFNMMKHKIQSPLRKFKLLLILPIVAGIFYAFSEPEYITNSNVENVEGNTQLASTQIGNITLVDNTEYTTKHLREALGIKKGDPFIREKIEKNMYGAVSDLYLNNGYLFFNIEMIDTVINTGVTDLTFRIFEGNQFKIGKVDVKGNDKVSTNEIKKIVVLRTGEIFSKGKLITSYNNLNNSGKFVTEKIDPEVIPKPSFRTVDIIFNVEEK